MNALKKFSFFKTLHAPEILTVFFSEQVGYQKYVTGISGMNNIPDKSFICQKLLAIAEEILLF